MYNHNDIRLINFQDLSHDEKLIVLKWRNDSNIKKWMYSDDDISLEEHLAFIESLKESHNKLYFLVQKNGNSIGVINFNQIHNKESFIGLYGNPNLIGAGITLLKCLIDYAFNVLNLKKLKAEVNENNINMLKLDKKFKFKYTRGDKVIDNKRYLFLELLAGEEP